MSGTRGVGETILILWHALQESDILYLADDEQEAEALAEGLAALAPDFAVVFVPSSDTLPGDEAPASPANIGARVSALRALRRLSKDIHRPHLAAIMSGEAAARLYPNPSAFDAAPPLLQLGDPIDGRRFADQMTAVGYVEDDRVDEPGEIAVRGDVIDIFPADAGFPVRIDIAEGHIAGVRRYDPISQLSGENCDGVEVGRAVEPQSDNQASILSHLSHGTLLLSDRAEARRQRFLRLAADAGAKDKSVADAADEAQWTAALSQWSIHKDFHLAVSPIPRFAEQRSPLASLARLVEPRLAEGNRFLLVGSERDVRFLRRRIEKKLKIQLGTVDSLTDLFALPAGSASAIIAPLDHGALSEGLTLVAAADLLGSRALVGDMPMRATTAFARGGDIRSGDIVVHDEHGVGRVIGLVPAPDDVRAEAIALEYEGGTRRLVPAHEAACIWRYGADADAVKLDRLDGSSWQKRRAAIDDAIAESARALLALAEQRARLAAPVIDPDPAAYEKFVSAFAFNETADQARTIQAVRDDLASGRPMDRLVIGDVGYGKTEVALRAAALAALAGYQIVLAAPTTVLVRQHFQTFERRFAGTKIKIASLSRLSGAAEKKAVKAGLADGSIAVVIGTAAVMGKDVSYAKLGLVIIDEEQRFGAADKAKLRGNAENHFLAMSATPIPRTLHRALIGLQQISVIATPPARRQPIRTSLLTLDDARIRTALLRERSRRGQSFVVVPRIEDMGPFSERLQRIVPDFNVLQAHGKLPAAEIDAAMVRFADGEGDVLLATNIIEAGLDVPRANTMIVWRADRFGLAQLHQLRGRVGRGNRRGQVMLVTDGQDLSERTLKRLRTLATHDRLGAGFEISAADLDQRGAGDPLSDAQAGHMKLIGIDLYQYLFEAALKRARGLDTDLWRPDINLSGTGALPAEWIPDTDIRLGLYVRIAHAADEADLSALEEELADRFGPLPDPAQMLLTGMRIALVARAANIARIDAGPAAIALMPQQGAQLPQSSPFVEKDGRWLLKERSRDEDRSARVLELLETLCAQDT